MTLETLNKLKEVFQALDAISDTCDDDQMTLDEKVKEIRLLANGELAELEEMIIKNENSID
jgi:hypothetical protein